MESTRNNQQDSSVCYQPLGKTVDIQLAGERIDMYLAKNFRFQSRAEWQQELQEGNVRVHGGKVKPAYRIKEGDQIIRAFRPSDEPDANMAIELLWQDEDILAAYKPSSLPMHENGAYRTKTFAHALKQLKGSEWGAVHRLDRETSGIVLCGRTPEIRAALSGMFAENKMAKAYLAIVFGKPEQAEWIDRRPLGDLDSSPIRIKRWINANGQSALTSFRSLLADDQRSLVLAQPKTGRTGQIRIHLAAQGHHLLGDILYHPDESVFLNWWEKGVTEQTLGQVVADRLCLHAYALQFEHPTKRQAISLSCAPKNDFWQWLPNGEKFLPEALKIVRAEL